MKIKMKRKMKRNTKRKMKRKPKIERGSKKRISVQREKKYQTLSVNQRYWIHFKDRSKSEK